MRRLPPSVSITVPSSVGSVPGCAPKDLHRPPTRSNTPAPHVHFPRGEAVHELACNLMEQTEVQPQKSPAPAPRVAARPRPPEPMDRMEPEEPEEPQEPQEPQEPA